VSDTKRVANAGVVFVVDGGGGYVSHFNLCGAWMMERGTRRRDLENSLMQAMMPGGPRGRDIYDCSISRLCGWMDGMNWLGMEYL
jgi:hypothetical protein